MNIIFILGRLRRQPPQGNIVKFLYLRLTTPLRPSLNYRPFRRQITGLVLNVSFWPELEHKMAFVYARKDDVAGASF